jgi:hypothetical protein
MNDVLTWLQDWYSSNCNGDWEHFYGIKIGNIDNPGWTVSIDLQETSLEDVTFQEVVIDRSDHDWIDCKVEGNKFIAAGGSSNLTEILEVFKAWAIVIELHE